MWGIGHFGTATSATTESVWPKVRTGLVAAAAPLRALVAARYLPEKHYMRGPGPAWHRKHGG